MNHATAIQGRARLLAVALGLVLALLAAEGLLRVVGPGDGVCYRLDPELLHDAVPGGRRTQLMPGPAGPRRIEVAFNALGLRGPLPREESSRVLLLGDSLVLAGNTPEAETLRARLETRLGGAQVLNAGRESYGPDQSLLWLRRHGAALGPDAVVLVLCAHNDFGDLVRNRLFEVGREGSAERARTALDPQLVARFGGRRGSRSALLRWLEGVGSDAVVEEPSDPERLLAAWLEASRAQVADARTGPPVVVDLEQDTYDADMALDPGGASAAHKRALMTAVLRALRADLDALGVPALAAVVPSAVDVNPSYPVRPDPGAWPELVQNGPAQSLLRCAEAAGWIAVDLTGPLEALGSDAFELGLDFHWSAAGQEAAAAALAPRVAGLLEL